MNAAAQLSMFEPEGAEALALLQKHLAEADKHRRGIELMELLGLPGAANVARRLCAESESRAQVLAILLDCEREAGL